MLTEKERKQIKAIADRLELRAERIYNDAMLDIEYQIAGRLQTMATALYGVLAVDEKR